ncbi:MAG TPA: dienelactone hydrolase family protein [Acidimicrobiales bacterium]|nr:dienelactone hydrolase family protein [Acidimicrobiales bacterium]
MAKTVTVTTTDGAMALYDAEPPGSPQGAVVVLQEAFGVNDHIEEVTRRFAGEGYRAVAPHLFHRSGDPVLDYGNFEKIMPHMQALTEAGLLADLDASLGYLADAGFAAPRVGVVGFCMGGTVVFLAAVRRALGAAVTFYGGGVAEGRFGMPSLVELAPTLKTPWLGLFGDRDQGIPVDQVEALRRVTATAPVSTEIVRYPEAGHGFHCDARTDSYHQASAEDGWGRTLDWFERYLAAGS